MPTTNDGGCKIHESVLRAYHIVDKVKYLLENEVPPKIILELITEMETRQEPIFVG